MPPPPEMWVEGFDSRLHAQNIQKYETSIQVWQTWRLDQTMWNCIAHYHSTAPNAITKEEPMPRVPEESHNQIMHPGTPKRSEEADSYYGKTYGDADATLTTPVLTTTLLLRLLQLLLWKSYQTGHPTGYFNRWVW